MRTYAPRTRTCSVNAFELQCAVKKRRKKSMAWLVVTWWIQNPFFVNEPMLKLQIFGCSCQPAYSPGIFGTFHLFIVACILWTAFVARFASFTANVTMPTMKSKKFVKKRLRCELHCVKYAFWSATYFKRERTSTRGKIKSLLCSRQMISHS